MAFNGRKTMAMIRQSGIKAKDFKAAVYPNRTGSFTWAEIERAKDLNASTLEGIADLLHCSIDEFFDRETPIATNHVIGDNNTVGNYSVSADPEVLAATNKHLRDVIDRQDKTIADLNRRIDQLIELAKRP